MPNPFRTPVDILANEGDPHLYRTYPSPADASHDTIIALMKLGTILPALVFYGLLKRSEYESLMTRCDIAEEQLRKVQEFLRNKLEGDLGSPSL